MTKRIFKSIFLTSLSAVLLASAFIFATLYGNFEARMFDELKAETGYILHALSKEDSDIEYFGGFSSKNRVTLIAADGFVLFDNTADASKMENHADRPEIASALDSGFGQSIRYSNTLSESTLYFAVKTQNGSILRVSNTQSSIFGLLWSMLTAFLLIIAGIAILSAVIARSISKRIVAPINALDLDSPLENETYDELSPLLLRMENQNKELKRKLEQLAETQREFTTVTQSMREGLVLFDASANIVSMNTSAARIFEKNKDQCIGNHVLCLNRSVELQTAVNSAQKGEKAEAFLTLNKRHYQLLASPFPADAAIKGIFLFILDVTEKHEAERSRREFTANITHELKTPLTSIIGYSEIMRDGVAQPKDMRDFSGRIYDEAARLITLVDDILRLSQMDELTKPPHKQDIDLLALAKDVCARIKPLADKNGITLSVKGHHAVIPGIYTLLDEMLYNLCDNAVKYNVPGGSVIVTVSHSSGSAMINVEDTGIGIPAEHQPHVFERFYRVDKSHSKKTGGTGLGLSIVKHAALIHDARIELQSEPGKGTSVRLIFNA